MFDEKRYTEAMINLRGCMDVNMIPEFIETDVKILLRYVGSLEVAIAMLEQAEAERNSKEADFISKAREYRKKDNK